MSAEFIIVSMHREENVDSPVVLKELLRALEMLAEKFWLSGDRIDAPSDSETH